MFKNYLKHTSQVITNHHFYPESSQGWLLSLSKTQWCKWHQNYMVQISSAFTVLLRELSLW